EQLGILSRDEALEKAKAAELDLVEVAPQADPPVARIMDFGKYRYEQDKQQKQQKKQRAGLVKEIRLSMKIGEHDLSYRVKKARTFLEEGQKVKFNLMMKGRENANPRAAKERVKELILRHFPEVKMDADPVRAGRSISIVVAPPKGGLKPADEKGAEDSEKKSSDTEAAEKS
ncbi:MAG: translation initiation factor IF-3, partial [Patescibacteria group bacterium]